MPRAQVDFSKVPSTENVPAGRYPFIVENVQLRTSKEKIDPDTGELSEYWNWELTITEGDFEDRRLWLMTSLVAKALWKLRGVLTNLEVELPKNEETGKPMLDYDYDETTGQITDPELIGLTGVAVVKMGSYNGQERSEVDTILNKDGIDLTKALRTNKAPGQQPKFLTKTEALNGGSEPATGSTVPLERKKMSLR